MNYLKKLTFPNKEQEFDFFIEIKRTVYDSYYPFHVLSDHQFESIDFEPITILYGGNGSGKTTALNVIAEKFQVDRDSLFNRSSFFSHYIDFCEMERGYDSPENKRIITSDDVFDYILTIRNINEGIDTRREELFEEYLQSKYSQFQLKSLDDYDELKKINQARSHTQSRFVRKNLMDNVRERSNGESAFRYFIEKIEENGLYLLDEPENSLSPARQRELVKYIEDSARFFGCQFVIATHSPFFLAMKEAKIYDLDDDPVQEKIWTELNNVRAYYDFFEEHRDKFE